LSERRVGLQLQVEHQLAEQDPGAMPRHDQAGVLAVPAEAGAGGHCALDDAGGVDQPARLDRVPDLGHDGGVE
jgi:hypothetical protein